MVKIFNTLQFGTRLILVSLEKCCHTVCPATASGMIYTLCASYTFRLPGRYWEANAAGPLLFGEVEEDLAKAVKCPQLLCPAGNDPLNVKPNGALVNIINAGYECKSVEFPEMTHGWVIRGDASQENVARDVTGALGLVSGFFAQHLTGEGAVPAL